MQVELLPKIHDPSTLQMPYWSKLEKYLDGSPYSCIHRAHSNTKGKILFADYHYHNLKQIYIPKVTRRETETPTWSLAEMYAIITNLYSALDSFANEINLLYSFQLNIWEVQIFHNTSDPQHALLKNKNCVRCRLAMQSGDPLSKFLEHELSQEWFLNMKDTRVQMVHREQPIYLAHLSVGDPDFPDAATVLLLPNQPCNKNPQKDDFSKHYDFNTYSQELRINVVTLIEQTYKILEPKIMALT